MTQARAPVFLGLSTAHNGLSYHTSQFSRIAAEWAVGAQLCGGGGVGLVFNCIGLDPYRSDGHVSWIKPHKQKKTVRSVGANLIYSSSVQQQGRNDRDAFYESSRKSPT